MVAAKAVSVKVPPQQGSIRNFTTIPETVQAIQFKDWSTAVDIFSFGEGFMFVPQGYEHQYRYETEVDRGSGHILETAPPFLLFKAESGVYRVDTGFWVVKKANDGIVVLANDAFLSQYQENQF